MAPGHRPVAAARDAYGDDVRGRLAAAEAMTEAELDAAERLRAELRRGMDSLFDEVDVLLLPWPAAGPRWSTTRTGRAAGEGGGSTTEGQHGHLREAVLPWTVPANLGGWPACSVPVGRDADGLPVGLQIVGPAGSDARVLDLAAELAVPLRPEDLPSGAAAHQRERRGVRRTGGVLPADGDLLADLGVLQQRRRAEAEPTVRPSSEMMTSPLARPACSAGEPTTVPLTRGSRPEAPSVTSTPR